MRARMHVAVACGAFLAGTPLAAQSASHTATLSIFASDATSTCAFFTMTGVAVADPVNPTSPWFALSKARANFQELYALALTAMANRNTALVVTTGGVAANCAGFAEVQQIQMVAPSGGSLSAPSAGDTATSAEQPVLQPVPMTTQ